MNPIIRITRDTNRRRPVALHNVDVHVNVARNKPSIFAVTLTKMAASLSAGAAFRCMVTLVMGIKQT